MKNLLFTGLTLISLLVTTSSATGESLEPIRSTGNLGSTIFRSDVNTNPAPEPPLADSTDTTNNCLTPTYGDAKCSSWGTTPAARERAEEAAREANRW